MRKKRILLSTCLALMLSSYKGTYAFAQTNGVKYEQVINSKPLTTVLKQLEDEKSHMSLLDDELEEVYKSAIDDAIEIVKAGGMNNNSKTSD